MSDGLQWLRTSFPEGFSVAFCEKVTPEDFIRRMGADPDGALMLTRDQAEAIDLCSRYPDENSLEFHDLDAEKLRELDFLRPNAEVLRFGSIAGWAFAIQSFGSYATNRSIGLEVSRSTRFVSFTRTANMASWVQYFVNGEVVNSFDPIHPVAGAVGGISVEGLAESEDPTSTVLARLEQEFSLEIPRATDFEPLESVVFG
ncbi:DUF6461 domain-containing protein [Streptomyces sp. NPDC047042]|uniref:DUF6461 domain-containing protein n=1 Tax=Streptomyces sp. NPDC047042 TaxID=3154807 RepID=UPI0033C27AE4